MTPPKEASKEPMSPYRHHQHQPVDLSKDSLTTATTIKDEEADDDDQEPQGDEEISYTDPLLDAPPNKKRALLKTLMWFLVAVGINAIVFHVAFQVEAEIQGTSIWTNHTSHICNEYCEHSTQCDHDMDDRPVLQQPINAWSNMAFVLVGLWPICNRVNLPNIVFLVANIYLCIASFTFHASVSKTWQHLDIAAVYTQLATLVAHGCYSATSIPWAILVFPLVGWAVALPFYKTDMDEKDFRSPEMVAILVTSIAFFTALLVVSKIVLLYLQKRTVYSRLQKLAAALRMIGLAISPAGVFLLALILKERDMNKSWCNPDSIIQGHAAWHVLTAVAALMIWEFFDKHQFKDLRRRCQEAAIEAEKKAEAEAASSRLSDTTIDSSNLSSSSSEDGQASCDSIIDCDEEIGSGGKTSTKLVDKTPAIASS